MIFLRRSICLILALALVCTSCMTPPRVISSPKTYIPLRRPARVWLTRPDGERVQVDQPRVLGDSLYGRTPGGEEVWVSLDGNDGVIQARQRDQAKTFAAIGGTVIAVVFVAALVGSSGSGFTPENEDSWVPLNKRRTSAFSLTLFRFGN